MLIQKELEDFARRYRISPREKDILRLLFSKTIHFRDLARELKISPNTVNNHFNKIFQKTNTNSKTELLLRFLNGFIESNRNRILFSRFPNIAVVNPSLSDDQINLLKKRSITTQRVNSLDEAYRLTKKTRLDGVISHLDGNKKDLLLSWKARSLGVPLIVIDDEIDTALALSSGACGILRKSFRSEKLLRLIYENVLISEAERSTTLGIPYIESHAIEISEKISLESCSFGSGGIFLSAKGLSENTFHQFITGKYYSILLNSSEVEYSALVRVEWKREKDIIRDLGILEKGIGVYLLEGDRLLQKWRMQNLISQNNPTFLPIGRQNQRGFCSA